MDSQETNSNFQNFTLEHELPEIDKLKEKGYVGFGAIAIILNEKGEILIIQEKTSREGQDKQYRWSLVYETGKEGENPQITMLAGIGSELGFEILSRLKQIDNRTFGFDFRRYEGDKPSRSLITVFTIPSDQHTDLSQWGSEVKDTKWIGIQDLLNLPETELRVSVKAIVKELNTRKLLTISQETKPAISMPSQMNSDYLLSREEIPDLYWK